MSAKSSAEPSGMMPNGPTTPSPAACIRPFNTSLMLPSPPAETIGENPASAASRASAMPCPGPSVTTSSYSRPISRQARSISGMAAFAFQRPAYGLTMILAVLIALL